MEHRYIFITCKRVHTKTNTSGPEWKPTSTQDTGFDVRLRTKNHGSSCSSKQLSLRTSVGRYEQVSNTQEKSGGVFYYFI